MESKEEPFFSMARYMVQCSNKFFRILRGEGIFIGGAARSEALQSGMDMNDSCLRPPLAIVSVFHLVDGECIGCTFNLPFA